VAAVALVLRRHEGPVGVADDVLEDVDQGRLTGIELSQRNAREVFRNAAHPCRQLPLGLYDETKTLVPVGLNAVLRVHIRYPQQPHPVAYVRQQPENPVGEVFLHGVRSAPVPAAAMRDQLEPLETCEGALTGLAALEIQPQRRKLADLHPALAAHADVDVQVRAAAAQYEWKFLAGFLAADHRVERTDQLDIDHLAIFEQGRRQGRSGHGQAHAGQE
jgi:hypothetical protein